MAGSHLSSDPTDRLIRELIATRRAAAPEEITRILDRIASAAFDPRAVNIPADHRGIVYGDRRLQPRDDSLFAHLVRWVVLDRQWMSGTTAEQFLRDLHRTARVEHAGLVVYSRRGGSIAGVLASTALVVPPSRLGPDSLPWLFVVYAADRGIIVSGYQVVSRNRLVIPEDAQWLRW
jgi:hypothetical protein